MASKKKIEKIYIVVPATDPLIYKTLLDAQVSAKDECSIGGQDMQIFEVVRAWYVQIPDEPEPEVAEDELENLLD